MTFDAQEPLLLKMGWGEFFRAQLTQEEAQAGTLARVVEPMRGLSRVACAVGEIWAEGAEEAGVGDWVVGTLRNAGEAHGRFSVTRVLARKTKLSRTAPSGKRHEQILCANADTLFVVVAMNQNLHIPGVERAIEAARAGGLAPVIVLTKSDACETPSEVMAVLTRFAGVPIHRVSVLQGTGIGELNAYFLPGHTIVLLGASGAGKSTLTNHFTGSDRQLVGETRESDEKGRHTTTSRRLHFLESGAMLVDSPGIRELQPWKEPETPTKSRKPKGARPPRQNRYDLEDDE